MGEIMQYNFLGIDLTDGVKPRHVLAYFSLVLISSGYAGAMATLQPGLLQVMGVDMAVQGQVTGKLTALQEVILILSLGPIGAIADRIGRKPVYIFGLLATALGFGLYPFAQSIGQLAAFRVIVAIGGAAMLGMMVTVIADYTRNSTRGHANGLQGFVATLGAFIPPILVGLPAYYVANGASELAAQKSTFGIAASMGIIGALIALIGLSPNAGRIANDVKTKFVDILSDGAKAAKDPGVSLSYGAAFISRGDLAITGAFIFLWLIHIGTSRGMVVSDAMGFAMPRILMVVIGALIGSIVMGLLADRFRKVTAVAIAAGLASFAYITMGFVEDPSAPWVFGLLAIMGVAEISAFVSSQVLVGQRARPDRRGAIIGFFGVAGAVGILIATMGGGILFDKVKPSAPFLLFGLLNLLVLFWALWLRRKEAGAPEPKFIEPANDGA